MYEAYSTGVRDVTQWSVQRARIISCFITCMACIDLLPVSEYGVCSVIAAHKLAPIERAGRLWQL